MSDHADTIRYDSPPFPVPAPSGDAADTLRNYIYEKIRMNRSLPLSDPVVTPEAAAALAALDALVAELQHKEDA